jgi:glycosyltransferase involved in cell wall biosynthesis
MSAIPGHHVAHLTSVHPRYDTRIYHKFCRSLAKAGYAVSLVVADGKGNERTECGVDILDVGPARRRISRMTTTVRQVRDKALELNADVYHLHDPELMPAGLALKRRGKRVIFDFHEDVPQQLLSKPYLSRSILRLLSAAFARFEAWVVPRFDAIVGATPTITEKYRASAKRLENINNFPILHELQNASSWEGKADEVVYVGTISTTRGIDEIVAAMAFVRSGARLNLGGRTDDQELKARLERSSGWAHVNELGYLSRDQIRHVLGRSMAGLVTLHPTPAYLDSLPVKMFEYMSAGLPVIASDFPLWREIIEGNDCGLCIDPLDPAAIAAAIDALVSNPARAEQMGRNGRAAVEQHFNWANEERKLLQLYEDILI